MGYWRWSGRLRWRTLARLVIAFTFGSISHAIAASSGGDKWWGFHVAVALVILVVLGFESVPPPEPEAASEEAAPKGDA